MKRQNRVIEAETKEPRCYRHGDLIIKPIKLIPKNAEKQKDLTLAWGEATGHHHTIVAGDAIHLRFDDKIYLKVLSKIARIDHPEHGLRILNRGEYEIDIQQEWKEEGWAKVID